MLKKIALVSLLSLVVASPFVILKTHRSESVDSVDISLPGPYLRTLMSLGKKSSLESMLESEGGTLMEKHWESFDFDLGKARRLYAWELQGRGRFTVRVSSADFKGDMQMEQKVHADRSGITVDSRLLEPSGFVKENETGVSISNSGVVGVKIRCRTVYQRIVPFWMCDEVDRRVAANNSARAKRMADQIRSIVE